MFIPSQIISGLSSTDTDTRQLAYHHVGLAYQDRALRPDDTGLPLIESFDPKFVGPASYDLAVGDGFMSPTPIKYRVVSTVTGEEGRWQVTDTTRGDGNYTVLQYVAYDPATEYVEISLAQGQPVLCQSAETVHIPSFLVGDLSMRSTPARNWLDHSVADRIWPGFSGQITFELHNNGPKPYFLSVGDRVLQLAFAMTMVPCGGQGLYRGRYANQHNQLTSVGD